MKLKEDIIISKIDGGYVLVDGTCDDTRFNGMVKLNETSKDIVEAIKECVTINDVVSKLLKEYEVDEKKLREDIIKVVDELRKIDLIYD